MTDLEQAREELLFRRVVRALKAEGLLGEDFPETIQQVVTEPRVGVEPGWDSVRIFDEGPWRGCVSRHREDADEAWLRGVGACLEETGLSVGRKAYRADQGVQEAVVFREGEGGP